MIGKNKNIKNLFFLRKKQKNEAANEPIFQSFSVIILD